MKSLHEVHFKFLWKEQSDIELQTEYRFDDLRKWRLDFAHVESKTAIEIEGKPWGGRHTRPKGFINDCEKYFTAQKRGWEVIRIIPGMITMETVADIIQIIGARLHANKSAA